MEFTEQPPYVPEGAPVARAEMPKANDEINVAYPIADRVRPLDHIGQLQVGERYRVVALIDPAEPDAVWHSTSLDEFPAGERGFCSITRAAETTNADGSPIEHPIKNFVRRFPSEDPRWKAGFIGLPIALLLSSGLLVWKRRRGRASVATDPAAHTV